MILRGLTALVLAAVVPSTLLAQDARTMLANVTTAMGADDLKTIESSGTGWNAGVGQSFRPTDDWPRFDVTPYTRTIEGREMIMLSFTLDNKYRIDAHLTPQDLIKRTHTGVANRVFGDMVLHYRFTDFRDVLLAGCVAEAPAPSNMGTATTAAPQQTGAASGAGLRTFVIVPAESRASYHASEEFFAGALKLLGIQAGKVPVVGTTQAIEGRFRFDPERPDAGLGDSTFTVQVNTLTSNQERRDDYMREIRDDGGPSFDRYPSATFRGTAIDVRTTGDDLKGQITGDMTIRDITQRVAFDVTARLAGDTLTGSATSRLRLSDFGIGPIQFANVLTVADEFGIEVEFTAREERR